MRGATTCDENTKAEVDTKTQTLVEAMLERNAISHDDIVSIIFTATDDSPRSSPQPRPAPSASATFRSCARASSPSSTACPLRSGC